MNLPNQKNEVIGIPQRMREAEHWLVYKLENAPGHEKLKKVPYSAVSGKRIDPTDSSRWTDFETAVAWLKSNPEFSGLGFALEDGFVGLDYDSCRNPESGEINPKVLADLLPLRTFVEISPSGEGIHAIGFTKEPLPVDGRRSKAVEIYSRGRFFTVTGNPIEGSASDVQDCTDELLILYRKHFGNTSKQEASLGNDSRPNESEMESDEAVVESCLRSKYAAKFLRLFDEGDLSEYSGNKSNADAALCVMLAASTRSTQQIDRIFRMSALYRSKWDELRGEQTYGEITIKEALRFQNRIPIGFFITDSGIFYRGNDTQTGEKAAPQFVCSRLEVVGSSRNAEGGDWTRILQWEDLEGRVHRWLMPMSMLAGEVELSPKLRHKSRLKKFFKGEFESCRGRGGSSRASSKWQPLSGCSPDLRWRA